MQSNVIITDVSGGGFDEQKCHLGTVTPSCIWEPPDPTCMLKDNVRISQECFKNPTCIDLSLIPGSNGSNFKQFMSMFRHKKKCKNHNDAKSYIFNARHTSLQEWLDFMKFLRKGSVSTKI